MIQRAFPWLIEELQSVVYLCYIYRIKHRIEISYGILFAASSISYAYVHPILKQSS